MNTPVIFELANLLKDKGFDKNGASSQLPTIADVRAGMQEFADNESEKKSIAFSNWRQEYVNELTHDFLIYTKGTEDTVVVNDVSDLYQYFIQNIYNK